jgi:heme a synthase
MPSELNPPLLPLMAEPAAPQLSASARAFSNFAALTLLYILGVVLFGAWVRVTGSGAGCGDHWPTCHGELFPRAQASATRIEFTHRVTSALSGLLAIALPLWARRVFPRGHAVRKAAWATLVLILVEGGIGAGLVKNRWVADNASLGRAVVVALHLTNTLLLTASTALAAACARVAPAAPLAQAWRTAPASKWLGAVWLAGLVLVSAAGAVTALGDTLFVNPAGVALHNPPGQEHFLVQLRVVHPVAACLVALLGAACLWQLYGAATRPAPAGASRDGAAARGVRWGAACAGALLVAQLALGALNIVWGAPGALQLVHLLLAQLVWLSSLLLVRYGLELSPRVTAPR